MIKYLKKKKKQTKNKFLKWKTSISFETDLKMSERGQTNLNEVKSNNFN